MPSSLEIGLNRNRKWMVMKTETETQEPKRARSSTTRRDQGRCEWFGLVLGFRCNAKGKEGARVSLDVKEGDFWVEPEVCVTPTDQPGRDKTLAGGFPALIALRNL